MAITVTISPLTRIEGHLAIHTEAEPIPSSDGKSLYKITHAECRGEMFRGFETILTGRDPLDAQQIMQRICGVCPISHGMASCRAQEMAYGIRPNRNGRLIQNLIFSANYLQSHILHFYHLSALDFVDITAVLQYTGKDRTLLRIKSWVESELARAEKGQAMFPAAPFLPRYEADYIADTGVNCDLIAHYVEALDIRRIAHEMAAVFGAKMPHSTSLVPGGCTQIPTEERVLTYKSRLKTIQSFIEEVYLPDVVTAATAFPQYWDVGAGHKNLLAYGAFEMDDSNTRFFPAGVVTDGKWSELDESRITEEVGYSKFSSSSKQHPSVGETIPDPRKARAYSWVKAPRYSGLPMEVGPLARVMTYYHKPGAGNRMKETLDAVLKSLNLPVEKMYSALGRHLSRVIEARMLANQMYQWLDELELNGAPAQDFKIPEKGAGYGLTEAPRGALGHWLSIANYKIKNYQCIVPTTWNCSPRDDAGNAGPVEHALEGVVLNDPKNPMEAARLVRSYDPCLACAIH